MRTAHGVTQRQVADHVGVDESTVSRWENGHQGITPRHWKQILTFFPRSTVETTVRFFQDLEVLQAVSEAGPVREAVQMATRLGARHRVLAELHAEAAELAEQLLLLIKRRGG